MFKFASDEMKVIAIIILCGTIIGFSFLVKYTITDIFYINNGYTKTTIAGHDLPVWVKK